MKGHLEEGSWGTGRAFMEATEDNLEGAALRLWCLKGIM